MNDRWVERAIREGNARRDAETREFLRRRALLHPTPPMPIAPAAPPSALQAPAATSRPAPSPKDGDGHMRPPGDVYVLGAAKSVTAECLETEAALTRFLNERCQLDPRATTYTRDVYGQWVSWCQSAGEWPSREVDLHKWLAAKFKPWRHPITRRRGFRGLRLAAANQEPPVKRSAAAGDNDTHRTAPDVSS